MPDKGGWLDQSDIFLHDAMIIARRLSYLKGRNKGRDEAHRKAAQKMGIKGRTLSKLMGQK